MARRDGRLTERMLAAWADGQVRDVQDDMMRLTLEIVAKTLFDADIGGDSAEVSAAMETLMRASSQRPASLIVAAALGPDADEPPGRARRPPARPDHLSTSSPSGGNAARTAATCSRCSCRPRTRRAAGG